MSGAETPHAMITRAGGTAGPVGLRVVDKCVHEIAASTPSPMLDMNQVADPMASDETIRTVQSCQGGV
jgi:hypothetical protein